MKRTDNDIRLIFAIGNPGEEYINTRHNVAIYFLRRVVKPFDINLLYKKKLNCYAGIYQMSNEKQILFAVSNSYMNNSGDCLIQVMHYYKINLDQVLVIQDEMLSDVGEISVKYNSSAHGHNGIKSISKKLNTNKFYKLKIGIGKPKFTTSNVNYVLGKFETGQIDKLNIKIESITNSLYASKFLNIIDTLKKHEN